jgi:hypothetical protein
MLSLACRGTTMLEEPQSLLQPSDAAPSPPTSWRHWRTPRVKRLRPSTSTNALAIKERVLGPEHPDVAMTLNNLAVRYKADGEYAKAEPLYQRALAIFEAALGPTQPKVITCRRNYAQLLCERQRQPKSSALEGHGKRTQTSRARRAKRA